MSAEYLEGMRTAGNDLALGNVGDPDMGARNPYRSERSQRTVDWQSGYDTTVLEAKKKQQAA